MSECVMCGTYTETHRQTCKSCEDRINREEIEALKAERDYWKKEALKHASELGEQEILWNVFKKGGVD